MKKLMTIIAGVLLIAAAVTGTVFADEFSGGPDENVYELDEEMEYELVCSGLMVHPVLNLLADSYEGVEYEDLLPYFCEQEFGVGEIRHALETAAHPEVELTYQEILAWVYAEGMDDIGWGEIWQELGLIGAGFAGMDNIEGEEFESENICAGEMIHPVLSALAESYDGVEYEDLLMYFCEQDFGVGEIRHALETAAHPDVELTYQEILAWAYSEGMEEIGWGEIWQELGLIGNPFAGEEGNPGLGLGQEQGNKPDELPEQAEGRGWEKEDHPGKGKGNGDD